MRNARPSELVAELQNLQYLDEAATVARGGRFALLMAALIGSFTVNITRFGRAINLSPAEKHVYVLMRSERGTAHRIPDKYGGGVRDCQIIARLLPRKSGIIMLQKKKLVCSMQSMSATLLNSFLRSNHRHLLNVRFRLPTEHSGYIPAF